MQAHLKFIFPGLAALMLQACGSSENQSDAAPEAQLPKAAETKTGSAPAAGEGVSTSDPAVAVLENSQVRFKLHGLLEFEPPQVAGLPVDPNKKYIMADLSCENIGTTNIYPAEYMLSATLEDAKGKQHAFVQSVKTVGLFDGHAQNKFTTEQSGGFYRDNFAPGEKARGYLYGFEVDKDTKFTRMSMKAKGLTATVDLK
ncbi:MAG TPA: hypothetical protein VFR58_10185 [Flavisolibacter sp.]|nr:hypothetical protein [Flavisolibacter sp.]